MSPSNEPTPPETANFYLAVLKYNRKIRVLPFNHHILKKLNPGFKGQVFYWSGRAGYGATEYYFAGV